MKCHDFEILPQAQNDLYISPEIKTAAGLKCPAADVILRFSY